MANAHENIDKLSLLNQLNEYLLKQKDYKEAATREIWEGSGLFTDILKLMRDKNMWERGNRQKNIGVEIWDEPDSHFDMPTMFTDDIIKAAATPSLHEDLFNTLTGIYDPKSEANIAGVKDVEGEKKLNALMQTGNVMHGDDVNILDIIKELK